MPHPATRTTSPSALGPRQPHERSGPVPMSDVERLASFVGGTALALYGLRRSLGHLALVAGGSALIYYACKGNSPTLRGVGREGDQSC